MRNSETQSVDSERLRGTYQQDRHYYLYPSHAKDLLTPGTYPDPGAGAGPGPLSPLVLSALSGGEAA